MNKKIPALRIEVNGKLVAIAGAEDLSILMGSVGYGAEKDRTIDASRVVLNVMGLAIQGQQPRQLTWGKGTHLGLGDRVTFELAEVEMPSPPDEILQTPSSAELRAAAEQEQKIKQGRKE